MEGGSVGVAGFDGGAVPIDAGLLEALVCGVDLVTDSVGEVEVGFLGGAGIAEEQEGFALDDSGGDGAVGVLEEGCEFIPLLFQG